MHKKPAVVGANQPLVTITFDPGNSYPDESDKGQWPIPPTTMVEGNVTDTNYEDFHVIVIDTDHCMLYELYHAKKDTVGTGWTVWSTAKYDLNKDYYRPDGWTSADAAGLPIFPGLVRYDEVMAGEIKHAVRFTVPLTQHGWIHPARHMAGKTSDTTYPPMGARMRLQANFSEAGFTGGALVIVKALKKYGMILADNGSAWFITGCHDDRWDDNNIGLLKNIPGSAFDAVYTGPVKHTADPNAMIGIDNKNIVIASTGSAGLYSDTINIANYGNQALNIITVIASDPAISWSSYSSVPPAGSTPLVISAMLTTQQNVSAVVLIESNDPQQPYDTVHVVMNISGASAQTAISLDKDSLTFDITNGVHGVYTDSIHISNDGNAGLSISNISASDPSLTWSAPSDVGAGNMAKMVVHANMNTQRNVHAKIIFSTNAPQHLLDTINVFMNIANGGVNENAPDVFEVKSYPNPTVSSQAIIEYAIGEPEVVSLKLYSPVGTELSTVVNARRDAGRYTSEISTSGLPNGVYLYRFAAGAHSASGKIVVAH